MYELLSKYQAAVRGLYEKVEATQRENIVKAGEVIATCVAGGGAVHLSNICHMIEYDLLNRGGGPAFYKRFDYKLNVDNGGVFPRDRSRVEKSIWGLARYALQASSALPGDVIVVSSVSGRTANTVDLAWEAKKFGLKVIALVSMEYANSVEAVHPSGRKLFEFADVTIDNCAPAAEAMIEYDGLDAKFAAASGVSSAYIMWGVTAVAVENLLQRGIKPGIYKSYNFPGGPEQGERVNREYKERGY